MTDLIGQISASIAIAKALLDVADNFNKAQYINQISDLTVQLAQARIQAAEMVTELADIKAELEKQNTDPLRYDSPVYRDNDGYAFCTACYDALKKRIHLETISQTGGSHFKCPICKNTFGI